MTLISVMFPEKVSRLSEMGIFLPRAEDWAPAESGSISHLLLLTFSTSVMLSCGPGTQTYKGLCGKQVKSTLSPLGIILTN